MNGCKYCKRRAKKIKEIGEWAADMGYDAWNIFIGENEWCRLMAVTKDPIYEMLKHYPYANIDWKTVRAVKLT